MKGTGIITAGFLCLLAAGTVGCRDASHKQAILKERDQWETSLKDSLATYEQKLAEAEQAIPAMRNVVGGMLANFTPVNNPREVEGYYIYTPARGSYPLTLSGVTARLSKSERPELIAVLSGARFSAIRLSANGVSVTSDKVPYDQALNYRAGDLNTVAFTGPQAERLLSFVAEHPDVTISIDFLNPDVVRTMNITPNQQETLIETAKLVEAQRSLRMAEAQVPLLSRKVQRLKETNRQLTLEKKTK